MMRKEESYCDGVAKLAMAELKVLWVIKADE